MAKGMNIKEKIASSLLDAFLNPLLAWFTEQAADNIPITMDAAKAKALELFHSFSNDTPEQQEIIVNYAGAFMDSSGIGVVMGRYKRVIFQGGNIACCGISVEIDRILTLSGLYRIMPRFESREEAVKALGGKRGSGEIRD